MFQILGTVQCCLEFVWWQQLIQSVFSNMDLYRRQLAEIVLLFYYFYCSWFLFYFKY